MFLYVVNLLKRPDYRYKKAAALIAQHKREDEGRVDDGRAVLRM